MKNDPSGSDLKDQIQGRGGIMRGIHPAASAVVEAAIAMLRAGRGTRVISATQEFVVPVGRIVGGGERLVYPAGEKIGQAIVDCRGRPVGRLGVVFFNNEKQAWQAARGDGTAVIIMNGIDKLTANRLRGTYRELIGSSALSPETPNLVGLLNFLRAANVRDLYGSTRKYVQSHMVPVDGLNVFTAFGETFGHMRGSHDVSLAIYFAQPFAFAGPVATSQIFKRGGVLLFRSSADAVQAIPPDVFARTYRLADGAREISDMSEIVPVPPISPN